MKAVTMILILCCATPAFAAECPAQRATCAAAKEAGACPAQQKATAGETEACAVKKPINLFNGEDFNGWKLFIPDANVDPATVWSVKDGVVHCTGNPAGYMRTETKYGNYRLRVEWRWPRDAGNSGVLLHIQDKDEVWPKSIEAQLMSGNAGDFWVIGGTDFKEHRGQIDRRVPKKEPSTEKPLGEWNEYVIECRDDRILVFVNGVLQNVATECTVTNGYIGLQSEGTPIEFRTVSLEPLK
ncbi:MAG TPA: DUF1080 domain-containing protein [Candidatus Hydrogenedentes bacterium]|nr:DUF1080 domain-containing protein [Candidatus Hydrogenedentota bacterium]